MLPELTVEYGQKPIKAKTYTVVALHLTMDYNSMKKVEDDYGGKYSVDVGYNLLQEFKYDLHVVPSDVAKHPPSTIQKITFVGPPFRPSMLQGQVSPALKGKLIDDRIATGTRKDEMSVEKAMYWLFSYGTRGAPDTRPRRYRYYNAAVEYASLKWDDVDDDVMFDDTHVHADELHPWYIRRVIDIYSPELPTPSKSSRSSRSSTSSDEPEFNTEGFWAKYDHGVMAHFVTVNDDERTRMAITTTVKGTETPGPSYIQVALGGGPLRWKRVRGWTIDSGALGVDVGAPILDPVGVRATYHGWHEFE